MGFIRTTIADQVNQTIAIMEGTIVTAYRLATIVASNSYHRVTIVAAIEVDIITVASSITIIRVIVIIARMTLVLVLQHSSQKTNQAITTAVTVD